MGTTISKDASSMTYIHVRIATAAMARLHRVWHSYNNTRFTTKCNLYKFLIFILLYRCETRIIRNKGCINNGLISCRIYLCTSSNNQKLMWLSVACLPAVTSLFISSIIGMIVDFSIFIVLARFHNFLPLRWIAQHSSTLEGPKVEHHVEGLFWLCHLMLCIVVFYTCSRPSTYNFRSEWLIS